MTEIHGIRYNIIRGLRENYVQEIFYNITDGFDGQVFAKVCQPVANITIELRSKFLITNYD